MLVIIALLVAAILITMLGAWSRVGGVLAVIAIVIGVSLWAVASIQIGEEFGEIAGWAFGTAPLTIPAVMFFGGSWWEAARQERKKGRYNRMVEEARQKIASRHKPSATIEKRHLD